MASEDLSAWLEDRTINRGTVLYTLSYQLTRTQDVEMFYAVYDLDDLDQYLTMFNGPLLIPAFEDEYRGLSDDPDYKYMIKNVTTCDILAAGETSAAELFSRLVATDSDFHDFVLDRSRMQSHFPGQKYLFKGYRKAQSALRRMRMSNGAPSKEDLAFAYRIFNYAIPSDGNGDAARAHDVAIQREKFFDALRSKGYGALVDTNDAAYGGFHARTPVVVFDMGAIELLEVQETTGKQKQASAVFSAASRLFGRR